MRTVFELPEFKPYQARFATRHLRMLAYRRYYDQTVYDSSAYVYVHKLYSETKSLLSYLGRAVDLDVGLIPGVMEPWQLAEETPDQIIEARNLLYTWSNWGIEADNWLQDATTCGEGFIKVVPMAASPGGAPAMVQLQNVAPETAIYLPQHVAAQGQTMPLFLVVDRSQLDAEGKNYEYAEAITPAEVRTYFNGTPKGYNGNPDRYPNPLRFVPVVQVKNDKDCHPTFSKALPQIDSVNELASYLNNIIGRHAEPQWAIAGARQGDLKKSGDNIWYLPTGAEAQALIAALDIEGALNFIREIKAESKANLPELAFDDLRAKAQIATETLEVQLAELDIKIYRLRRRYDAALLQAHGLAARAAVTVGVAELASLLVPHTMDYRRPVRPISKMEQIAMRQAELGLEMAEAAASGDGMTAMAMPQQQQPAEQGANYAE